MKIHKILILAPVAFLIGCSSMKTIKDDYMDGNKAHKDSWKDASDTFQRDYLGKEKTTIDRQHEADLIFKAKKELMDSAYVNDYLMASATIDEELMMPEAQGYVFIYFLPVDTRPELKDSKYLIVYSRFDDKKVYNGIYEQPAGDPMYRYNAVINSIQNPSGK